MLTHRSFVANTSAVHSFDGGDYTWNEDDVFFSFLPLAHVFERISMLCNLFYKA
jgi:long-subunit acyl-CoA synthetase (AMP-forming)